MFKISNTDINKYMKTNYASEEKIEELMNNYVNYGVLQYLMDVHQKYMKVSPAVRVEQNFAILGMKNYHVSFGKNDICVKIFGDDFRNLTKLKEFRWSYRKAFKMALYRLHPEKMTMKLYKCDPLYTEYTRVYDHIMDTFRIYGTIINNCSI